MIEVGEPHAMNMVRYVHADLEHRLIIVVSERRIVGTSSRWWIGPGSPPIFLATSEGSRNSFSIRHQNICKHEGQGERKKEYVPHNLLALLFALSTWLKDYNRRASGYGTISPAFTGMKLHLWTISMGSPTYCHPTVLD